jgi:hypothetical protein
VRPEFAWLTNERVRLALLLAALASLAAYALMARAGPFGFDGSATGEVVSGCPSEQAPALASVSRTQLLAFRAGLDRMTASSDPGLRPYEEGLVPATSSWTDAEPAAGVSRLESGRWPAGYEVRWWLGSGDDVVADVFVFASSAQARDFSRLVLRPGCGSSRLVSAAAVPPGAHNLEWRNPLGFAEEDVYLRRGRRIYRVAVVKAGADGKASAGARRAAFTQIDALACGFTFCR